jgi:hypothetical protein
MNGNRPAARAIPHTAAAVLMRAAKVIEANGWCQNSFLDLAAACYAADPRDVPVCAAGAIRVAAGHDPDDGGAEVPAMRVFAYWLAATGAAGAAGADPVERIGFWNDDPARTATEVAAELRQAAAAEAA